MAIVRINLDKHGCGKVWIDGKDEFENIESFKIVATKGYFLDGKQNLDVDIEINNKKLDDTQKERITIDINDDKKKKTKKKK